jgi:hypothetical protein
LPPIGRNSDAKQLVIFNLKRIEASKADLEPSDVFGDSKIYVNQIFGLVTCRRIIKIIVPVKLPADFGSLRQNGRRTKVIAGVGAKSQMLFPMVNPCVVASQASYRPIGMIVPKTLARTECRSRGRGTFDRHAGCVRTAGR